MINSAAARRLEQRRLAYTRITADHQRTALMASQHQSLIHEGKFILTARQRLYRHAPPTPGSHQRLVTSLSNRKGTRPFG
jgi:hypothetical protein